MKTIRALTSLLVPVLAIALLIGCTGQEPDDAVNPGAEQIEPIEDIKQPLVTDEPEPEITTPAPIEPEPEATTPAPEEHEPEATTQEPEESELDLSNIADGVVINHIVTSDEAELTITSVPKFGDSSDSFIHGILTKGNYDDYETITLVCVGGVYYGKKPLHALGNMLINDDSTFSVQFNSAGNDRNATVILIFLVRSGFVDGIKPDVADGYAIPRSQIDALIRDSVCVVQIDRS